ncbi:ecotropic viral integration site 5 ortholog-like isoform X2 [Mercenaria mercenaria]|uniref:ecotropic viral integration site 5 ortholog-like isoform X2 n=1 Tax=Mercenaria mercenaria TaxID=6596 RepID=UPI00234FA621|nr:ecotropic viral integration site 5 ortholog-like isoform X2 [Mercenaria mercenaria]
MSTVEKAGSDESATTTTIETVPHPPDDSSVTKSEKTSKAADTIGNQSVPETTQNAQTAAKGTCGGQEEKGGGTEVLHPSDLELLAKLEEANRQIALSPSSVITTDPTELELIAKLEEANRLLEADKKGITPSHSRNGSSTGLAGNGHSRKGSSTSQISTNSSTSQHVEEDSGNSGNLWEIWGKLVNDWASAKKKPAFIKQLVRKGIPHPFRGLAWQLLLGVNHSPMKDMYVEYLKQKSPSEKMIRRDIARTFPEHDFFKEKDGLGQESLFNVMKAYSLHDREVGYCQGSGFIVGLLLMQMPEEEAFAVLVKLMQDYRLRELFKPSMAELGLCMYKLECLIQGMDVIFRIGIAILQSSQPHLLSMDMECMLQFFQKDVASLFQRDEDTLFNMACQVRFSAKKFKRLEKEYTALKSKENEDQIELRRLRTENRLLRQRIDNLEKESASLADRLIQYQLTRAQEAEETYALKNELSLTKQKYSLSQKQLKEAEALLGDIKERTDSIHSASSLDEGEAQVVIQGLQEELIMVRLREAENSDTIKQLRNRIEELQQLNTRLQQAPSNDVQCLQEELIAVKLREAEANLSLKEMRQTVSDLEANWQNHLASADPQASPKEKGSKSELKAELKRTQEELMTSKLREAGALSHLKDAKQRIMELETSNQICSNQIKRMDEENKRLKGEIEEHSKSDEELSKQIKGLLRKIDDLESKRREEGMMARIREAESDQIVGELKQKIAQMEIQREEVIAADQLESKGGKQDLENTIYDLQEEVMQLKMAASPKSPNTSASSSSARSASKVDEDDFNDDDDDDIEDPESLNRTLSEIIEGKRSSTSLIAILNRDNSDCDSIKSSSSETSSSGQKVVKSNSFKGSKSSEFDRLTSVEETSSAVEVKFGAENQSKSGIGENSAINQSSCENKSETQSVTGLQTSVQSNDKNSAITETQSQKDINKLANGEISAEMDANENISSKGVKQKTIECKNDTSQLDVSV